MYFCFVSKIHFKYNPKTLAYEEVSVSVWRKLFRVVLWLAPNVVVGLLLAFIFTQQLDAPREKQQQAEIKRVDKELLQLRQDFTFINDFLDEMELRDEDLYRNALHAKEFPDELRMMGAGGSDKYSYLLDLPNSELLIETKTEIDKLERRLYAQSLSFKELMALAKENEKMLSHIPAIQPVRNSELKRGISGFGWRIDPHYRTRRMHSGIDFTADRGTEVYATGDGFIETIESKRWGYGKSIVIDHGFGYKTRYAHLSAFKVNKGQKIKRGELIGLIGSTGKSTGPHLHYEVIKDGKKINPIGFFHSDLSPEQYEQLLEMSDNSHKAFD